MNQNMNFTELVGKTIKEANQKQLMGYDDIGFLELKFTDETKTLIVANFGGYSGESKDEYPTTIYIDNVSYEGKLTDI